MLNDALTLLLQTPEKELDKVKGVLNKHRGSAREEQHESRRLLRR